MFGQGSSALVAQGYVKRCLKLLAKQIWKTLWNLHLLGSRTTDLLAFFVSSH